MRGKKRQGFRLKTHASLWILAAFLIGAGAAAAWFHSNSQWERYLNSAYQAGFETYASLRSPQVPPNGVSIQPLGDTEVELANIGRFERIGTFQGPTYVTHMSIHAATNTSHPADILVLAVLSDALVYPVSNLATSDPTRVGSAPRLGALTRLMANFCSESTILARYGDGPWLRIDGNARWGCAAEPRDLRIPAVLLALIALLLVLDQAAGISARFGRFAEALTSRRQLGGPESYETSGPTELREIVDAVNSHLRDQREQLSKRAVVLSGVSHDLGTPATRLRLRAALIEDADLRAKFERDIDQMTGIIESVLTYTRSELNTEPPRKLALASLVDALVADYQDLDRPVVLVAPQTAQVEVGQSVFTARIGRGALPDDQPVVVIARPVSLQRAISNLIENALKYGRRAYVSLETTAQTATITVEDEGTHHSVADIEKLMAPFQRGTNTQSIDGFGLGLTIASTVAEQHGGSLQFSTGSRGLAAHLTINRW